MQLNLLCLVFGMHTLLVKDQNSDKPYYKCVRCGKERPFEPLDIGRLPSGGIDLPATVGAGLQ